jgi:alpha-glucosidase
MIIIIIKLDYCNIGATWNDLKSSIISMLDFNLFGVPMIGADICGFIYDSNEELCARWIEVGAFYPFSRNHNAINQAPQELYLWDSVAEASRNALNMRYQLLPYLYSLFYTAHTTGSTVARALWGNFPTDVTTQSIEGQFMWGNGLLISPVLTQGATSVSAYFPQQYWYSFADQSFFLDASNGGQWKTLSTPLTTVNVHVKGGSILPLQQAALTTVAARQTPFTLLVAICPHGKAIGSLYWDDGEQIELTNYLTINYEASYLNNKGTFTATVTHNSYTNANTYQVGSIVVMAPSMIQPTSITLGGVSVPLSQATYNSAKKSLEFTGLNVALSSDITLEWQ